MAELRPHAHLDQLRRQARDLHRAAGAGERAALERLGRQAPGLPTTLARAQLALARELGYDSWAALKRAVERQPARAAGGDRFVLRRVRAPEELVALWATLDDILGATGRNDRKLRRALEDFDRRRPGFLLVEQRGRVIGGAAELSLLALEPAVRGRGLGRRLVQTVEVELVAAGRELRLHADDHNKAFFARLGYQESGASKRHMYKGHPSSERLRERRISIWRSKAGDLDTGVVLEPDPSTGSVPGLPW